MKDENVYLAYKEQQNKNINLLDKEKILLSQKFSCEILLVTLASGEKCVYHYHKNRKYRYYDPFTTGKSKGQDDLELEFRNQVRCFQTCFIDDVKKGGFRYPDNLNKQDIIDDIKKWNKFAEMGFRDVLCKTYQKLITLLEGEKKIDVDINKNPIFDNLDIINKGIFKGLNKNEISNLIEAAIDSSNYAFNLENKFKSEIKKRDHTIEAKLYQDNLYQKKVVSYKEIIIEKEKEKEETKKSSKCC